MNKKLFLLDGMAQVYRSYFAFMRNPMINSKGKDVSAVFGFLSALLEIIDKQNPTHLAVAFDVSGNTFRYDEFPEYKAQRDETPEEIRVAVPRIMEFLAAFKIPVLTQQGYEADDIIGTLARRAEKDGFDTYMVTPDKDFAQLVDEHTFMMKPAKKGVDPEVLGVPEILEQWGIEKIEQVIDILGMAGDAADNIPGIPGIGLKTAQKLIAKYGSMENMLAHTDELKGKQKEKIEANIEQAHLCKRLVTIHTEVPIKESPADLIRGKYDKEKLTDLFSEFEFNYFYKRLFGKAAPSPAPALGQGDLFAFAAANTPVVEPEPAHKTLTDIKHNYTLIQTLEERVQLAEKLKGAVSYCFDVETTGLNPRSDKLIGIAFALKPHEAWYITLPPDDEEIRKALEPFAAPFADESIEKVGHNLKFDIAIMQAAGIEVRGKLFDTMLAHYLLDPDQQPGQTHLNSKNAF